MNGQMLITRVVEFSAAHRLYREDWSTEANRETFGACANPYGHGHNYQLEVSVHGEIDAETGMVVHFQRLKSLLTEVVIAPLDHRHLNHDVPFMEGRLPTSENLLLALWDRLSIATVSEPWKLYCLRLKSTGRNWAEYYGGKLPHGN